VSLEPADSPDPARSAWRLIRDRDFGRYFFGNLVSNVGTWFQDIAAALFIFDQTGSAAAVGAIAVASYGSSLVFAPLGGQLADRFDRRRLLMATHTLLGVVAGVLAAAVLLGYKEIWLLFVVMGLLGIGRAVNTPALQAIVPALVPMKDLASASALSAVTFNLARALGPVLGALVFVQAGAGAAFAINAASFLVFVALLAGVHQRPRPGRKKAPGGVLAGFGYVRRRPVFIAILLAAVAFGMATDPVITLGPSLSEHFETDAQFAGYVVTAFGVGSILSAPFVSRIRSRIGPMRTATFAYLGIALGFLLAALGGSPAVALAGLALSGFCYLVGSSDVTTTLQELLDDDVRGRVMALWSIGFHGSRPVAALLDGGVADAVSPTVSLAVMAGIMVIASAGLWRTRVPPPGIG
jgi:MFS family permease